LTYYTYLHSAPDGEVFYVGKGKDQRAYSMSDRSWIWRKRFNQLNGITIKIVNRFDTEPEAFQHEQELVRFYKDKGCDLVNLTEGGKGVNGYRQSPETRAKRSEKMRGYVYDRVTCPHCKETGGKTSMMRWHFDKCTGPAKRYKARATLNGERINLGKFVTKEEAKAVVDAFYKEHPRPNIWLGRKHSDETRKKMSEVHKGQPGAKWTDEAKQKLSEKRIGDKNPFYGRKHTDETRKIITEKNIGREGYWTGKSFSKEHIAKLKIDRTCPHCGVKGSGSAMNRWHMDNCKFKAEAA
jgi:hypothetical protein